MIDAMMLAAGSSSVNTDQTEHAAACYGMGCPFRGDCQLFAELGISDGVVWAHCWDGAKWSKFTPVTKEPGDAPSGST